MNIDEQNEVVRKQVDEELPRPVGGFEDPDDEDHWKDLKDARFLELCRDYVDPDYGGAFDGNQVTSDADPGL